MNAFPLSLSDTCVDSMTLGRGGLQLHLSCPRRGKIEVHFQEAIFVEAAGAVGGDLSHAEILHDKDFISKVCQRVEDTYSDAWIAVSIWDVYCEDPVLKVVCKGVSLAP
ncbi:MAG: hypothetical protein IPN71_12450 [Fibrobacteres bacterium]|nr:hypothetical protein [Fibrobacterota bacterium]